MIKMNLNVFMSRNQVMQAGQVMRKLAQQNEKLFSAEGYTTEMLTKFGTDLDELLTINSDTTMIDKISEQSGIKRAQMEEVKKEIKYFRMFARRLNATGNPSFQVFNQSLNKNTTFSSIYAMANLIIEAFTENTEVFVSIGIPETRMEAFKAMVDTLVEMRNDTEVKKSERGFVTNDRKDLLVKVYNELLIISDFGKTIFKKNPSTAQFFKLAYYKPKYAFKDSPPAEVENEPKVTVNFLTQ